MFSRRISSAAPLTPQHLQPLRAQLAPGERIAWASAPVPEAFEAKATQRNGIGKWEAVAILGGGYATITACVAAFRSGQWFWLAVPVALIVLGLLGYFVATQIRERRRHALASTIYALTTRRALIVRPFPKLQVQALPIEAIKDVVVTNTRGPFADLDLADASQVPALTFQGVVDAERAQSQMKRVIKDPKATDDELAASEAYLMAMRQMSARPLR